MESPADPGHLKPLTLAVGRGGSQVSGLHLGDPCFLKGCLGGWKEGTPWVP